MYYYVTGKHSYFIYVSHRRLFDIIKHQFIVNMFIQKCYGFPKRSNLNYKWYFENYSWNKYKNISNLLGVVKIDEISIKVGKSD